MENWKAVPGYEGVYEVSDLGRVRSIDRVDRLGRKKRGVVLSQETNQKGRKVVNLQSKRHMVHQLVLRAFVGPCPDGLEGCHNSGDHTDNALSNLRWDTRSSNTLDAVAHGTNHMTRRTECPSGHPLVDGNLVQGHLKRGWRACLICHREKSRESYRRRRAITCEVSV